MGTRQEWGLVVLAVLMTIAGFFEQNIGRASDPHDWGCENPHIMMLRGQRTVSCVPEKKESGKVVGIAGFQRLLFGMKMNLNEANEDDLQVLPRIGPVLSARIVSYRKKFGAFQSLQELIEVKGIGQKTLAKIRPFLTISDR